jgi:diphthamide biosynthesis enzyme Dph1/Dph2 domain
MTIEEYAHEKMKKTRLAQIEKFNNVKRVGIILGVLGRQGSLHILEVRSSFILLTEIENRK